MCDAPVPTPVCPLPCVPCGTDAINTCETNFGVLGHIPGTACTAGLALVLEPGPYGGRVLKAVPITADTAVPAVLRFACGGGTTLHIQPAHAVDIDPEIPSQLFWWIPAVSGGDVKYYAFISTELPAIGNYIIGGQFFYKWTTDGQEVVTNCFTYPFQIAAPESALFPQVTAADQVNLVVVKNDPLNLGLQLGLNTVVVAPYLAVPPVATTQVATVGNLPYPVPRGLGSVGGTVFSPYGTRVVEVIAPVLA
jgi:hypothetical protein